MFLRLYSWTLVRGTNIIHPKFSLVIDGFRYLFFANQFHICNRQNIGAMICFQQAVVPGDNGEGFPLISLREPTPAKKKKKKGWGPVWTALTWQIVERERNLSLCTHHPTSCNQTPLHHKPPLGVGFRCPHPHPHRTCDIIFLPFKAQMEILI